MNKDLKFRSIGEIINKEFPSFDISTIKKIGEGDNSNAFLINRSYIFRFPKRQDVKQHLRKEVIILPQISSSLDIEIPLFKFVSRDYSFTGYKMLPGKFLTKNIFFSQNKRIQTKIINGIADFLYQLHHFPSIKLNDFSLEIMNLKEEYSEDFENTQKLIFPEISNHQQTSISNFFNEYLTDTTNFNYSPVLIHNDFSVNHILFDENEKKINGVIDFGDMAFGDADYDFMYLFDCFGKDFIEKMLKYYDHPSPEKLFKKLTFFSLANKLQTLIVSIKENDKDDIREGYTILKRWNHSRRIW
jgi:aminoglycoside 2''-phosphotransferase